MAKIRTPRRPANEPTGTASTEILLSDVEASLLRFATDRLNEKRQHAQDINAKAESEFVAYVAKIRDAHGISAQSPLDFTEREEDKAIIMHVKPPVKKA